MAIKAMVFAGGCFWGIEKLYRSIPGVVDAVAGYANGDSPENANYEAVCTGYTGYREAVRVSYDTDAVSLKKLLFAYYCVIDPTRWHRQAMDFGSQYQTGLYWEDEEDGRVVRAVSEMEATRNREFYVELFPLSCFYPAEEYHQRYLEKNRDGYCHISPLRLERILSYPYSDEGYDRPALDLLGE